MVRLISPTSVIISATSMIVVDKRHLMLVADMMTFSGAVRAVGRMVGARIHTCTHASFLSGGR